MELEYIKQNTSRKLWVRMCQNVKVYEGTMVIGISMCFHSNIAYPNGQRLLNS